MVILCSLSSEMALYIKSNEYHWNIIVHQVKATWITFEHQRHITEHFMALNQSESSLTPAHLHPTFELELQYIPRNMHTVFALLCFVVVIHWLISQYPSSLLHWHCGNLTIVPVPAKQPCWIWINTSCEFIMNDCTTTTKQSTTKPCAYFLGYTVQRNHLPSVWWLRLKSSPDDNILLRKQVPPCWHSVRENHRRFVSSVAESPKKGPEIQSFNILMTALFSVRLSIWANTRAELHVLTFMRCQCP